MQVIESKIEGRETVDVEPAEEPTKLVDLMAALQASVNAATSAREAKGGKPVSVAEAKEQRAAKGKAAASKAKDTKPAAKADDEEERPARRRKSA
jgi:DNA end-binding protein Ku